MLRDQAPTGGSPTATSRGNATAAPELRQRGVEFAVAAALDQRIPGGMQHRPTSTSATARPGQRRKRITWWTTTPRARKRRTDTLHAQTSGAD